MCSVSFVCRVGGGVLFDLALLFVLLFNLLILDLLNSKVITVFPMGYFYSLLSIKFPMIIIHPYTHTHTHTLSSSTDL